MTQKSTGPLRELFDSYKSGAISRRSFAQGALALGVAMPTVAYLSNTVAAQDSEVRERPTFNTEGQERGAGGQLDIIQWQAATMLSPHEATGVKDILGSVTILEPLIHYLSDASMIPNLLTEMPTIENGGVAEDLTSVTLHLLPDVLWSDGEPFTAADVAFTIDYVQNPENNCTTADIYEPIANYEVIDDLTIKVNFKDTNPFWFTPFAGTSTGYVYPKHQLEGMTRDQVTSEFWMKPIGTGPYVVESFTPNDSQILVANENYREPNKPFFSRVVIKGGGDAAAAARAVLQTGESDFAWNLQIEPDILNEMVASSEAGNLVPYPGISVERINYNFSDPNTEVDGQKSEMHTPHPFLSDDAVRKALNMAVDRELIAEKFYGGGQQPATNIINGDPRTDSPNTSRVFDLDAAAAVLDEAGWVMDGDVRAKDGVKIEITYATTVNAVRQKTQAVVKQNWESIGVKVNLEQIDAGIYFDGAEGTEQNINHFYWDICMYQSVPSTPRDRGFMSAWYAGPDGSNIAQKSNKWQGQNICRYSNADYDALYDASGTEADPDKLADLFIAMNDHVINNNLILPLVIVGSPRGASKRLRQENLELAAFSYDYWNIANWNLADGYEDTIH